uniref:Uncharacterized protein n=1 Tax=Oryza sativa subsp. japonica TaxID=39947 RepID=Q6ZJR3_ORYSJ|nr:hypothetical protein [Oryza sativa Japonica Group]
MRHQSSHSVLSGKFVGCSLATASSGIDAGGREGLPGAGVCYSLPMLRQTVEGGNGGGGNLP